MPMGWKQKLDEVRMKSLQDIFEVDKPVIGMVHLPPLPDPLGTITTGWMPSSKTHWPTRKPSRKEE